MTHKQIRDKFMIEYDKANVTSSYPSFTKYEIETFLDKAYNALIAQKVTGNNLRRAAIETDVKSISDLQPLMITSELSPHIDGYSIQNLIQFDLPDDFLYFVSANLVPTNIHNNKKLLPVQIVDHNTATRFFYTAYNMPWIKIPVCYIENNILCVLYDIWTYKNSIFGCEMVYIKTPKSFINSSDNEDFECNDTVAEELLTLAVTFALENIESSRLTAKLNTRGLEV